MTLLFRYIPIESFSAKLDLMSDKITGRVFKDLYKKLNLSDKASCEIEALWDDQVKQRFSRLFLKRIRRRIRSGMKIKMWKKRSNSNKKIIFFGVLVLVLFEIYDLFQVFHYKPTCTSCLTHSLIAIKQYAKLSHLSFVVRACFWRHTTFNIQILQNQNHLK